MLASSGFAKLTKLAASFMCTLTPEVSGAEAAQRDLRPLDRVVSAHGDETPCARKWSPWARPSLPLRPTTATPQDRHLVEAPTSATEGHSTTTIIRPFCRTRRS